MAKGKISLSDFPVAERRKRSVDLDKDTAAPPISHVQEEGAAKAGNESASATSKQDKPLETTPEQHRASAIENANRREDSRNRLRELRKARERESKHFVNVSLDYETKRRLEKAAHDNGLKMTVILRDAIDQYLKDNGY
ncbi:ribbon-helix-helix protein, CopG family [Ochrobactrum soli]|uniref:ribbon-helix-helix protein, CopG family n=1 Tax=Ochrobactrum soli TaxID=2448455 RepID=UPI001F47E8F8|nr:ribbon-helix-helix protein, CopG family [[Ochrobactrum] soli]